MAQDAIYVGNYKILLNIHSEKEREWEVITKSRHVQV